MTLEMYKRIRPLKGFMPFLGSQTGFNPTPLLLWGDWRNRLHTNQYFQASQTIGKIGSVLVTGFIMSLGRNLIFCRHMPV